jgi:hypothetical protein
VKLPDLKTLDWKRLLANPRVQVGGVVSAGVLIALVGWFLHAKALPPTAPPATPPPAATPAPPVAEAAPSPPPEPLKATVTITFTTIPLTNATVSWGKTRLGLITPKGSLVIERPRDSGPLDVIVRAPGYLQVQVRAHTFADSRVLVKLTKPDQTQALVGYKAPIDAGVTADTTTPEAIAPPPFP